MALALTGSRRNAAAAVSVIAAVALAIAVVGRGCRVATPGPDAAVRSLLAASSAGDRKAVYALLSPATQARLDDRARRATALVGSNVRYTALDLISIASSDEDVEAPSELKVVSKDDEHAVVEVSSSAGKAELDVVKVDGRWRIDLPEYGTDP